MLTEKEFNIEREIFLSDLRLVSKELKILVDGLPKELGYPQYVEIVGKLKQLNNNLKKCT